jgi:hypothetical protein
MDTIHATITAEIPAKAGTQYAASFRFESERLSLLDPRLRGDFGCAGGGWKQLSSQRLRPVPLSSTQLGGA